MSEGISNDVLMELIIKAMPYSDQIKEIDLTGESIVYFTWRDDKFKISGITGSIFVCTIHGICGHGDNISIILEALLKKQSIVYMLSK